MLDGFLANGVLALNEDAITAGARANAYFAARGIDTQALSGQRRPLSATAWTGACGARIWRGRLGAAILDKALAEKWVRRERTGVRWYSRRPAAGVRDGVSGLRVARSPKSEIGVRSVAILHAPSVLSFVEGGRTSPRKGGDPAVIVYAIGPTRRPAG